MSLFTRIVNAFRSDRLNRELDQELRLHIEEAVAAGRDEQEARRAFGVVLRARERSHDIKALGWLEALLSDTRFGVRQLRKNWKVSGAAALSLALAIGACTGAFRLIDAVLLRPLPVAHPEQLHYLDWTFVDQSGIPRDVDSFSYPLFRRMRDAARAEAQLFAISYATRQDLTYGGDTEMEKAYRQYVSGTAFSALGLTPALGRLLSPADDQKPGTNPVAVLSYDYWSTRFGRDPKVIGRSFHMDGKLYQVVGVGPRDFTGTETGTITDLFTPTMMNASAINESNWQWFRIWVRPLAGHTESVRDRLQAIFSAHLREDFQQSQTPTDALRPFFQTYLKSRLRLHSAATGASQAQQEYGRSLVILGVLVGLVLLIACVNVANLLTAQTAARSQEMALRISIGAGRFRLFQLVLVESAVLAILATALGALFAWWSAPWVASMVNAPDHPLRLILPADWRVLGFSALLVTLVTLFFGLVPALRASNVEPINALKGGDRTAARNTLMHFLVGPQIAFCLLVNFTAGLFVASFDRLSHQPLGFSADRLLLLETTSKDNRELPADSWRQVAAHLRSLQGVESVARCGWPLLSGNAWTNGVRIPGEPPGDFSPYFLSVSPGFLTTMRIPLLGGRDFTNHDQPGSAEKGHESSGVAIVNQAFARRYFHGRNPVAKSFELSAGKNVPTREEIVGLMGDLRYRNLREAMQPLVFLPAGQDKWGTFAVRASVPNPSSLFSMLRAEVQRVQPDFYVTTTNLQQQLADQWSIRERLLAAISVFFAGLALLLAAIGLFGVLNYSVLQRTREIGIRMALGARVSHVVSKVTAQVFAVVIAGVALGLAAGLAAQRLLETLLFDVKPTELAILATPLICLFLATILAAVPPVIRAVRIDPARALRSE